MSAADEAFERAFWQALDDLKEGSEKPIEDYLRLVPREQRDELGRILADVLLARGPTPASTAAESEGYKRAVAVVDEVLGSRGVAGILPGTLKAMRNARGIEPEAVVERLAAARPASQGPSLRSAPAMGRSSGARAPSPSPPTAQPPDPEVELVERLFHGGPDA